VSIEALRAHLPPELEVDTFGGDAYLGVTPFRVTNLRLRGLPPVPLLSSFLELNCRTYVRHDGEKPGIWFFSLDASSRFAVEAARRLYRLPYFRAEMSGPPRFSSRRLYAEREHVWESSYRPTGSPSPAEEGTLEHFLTERYCLYTTDEAGVLHSADIHHPPWPLQPARAELAENTMTAPLGIRLPEEQPLLHYAARQDVLVWPLRFSSPRDV
jgi:uncharacterized protein